MFAFSASQEQHSLSTAPLKHVFSGLVVHLDMEDKLDEIPVCGLLKNKAEEYPVEKENHQGSETLRKREV